MKVGYIRISDPSQNTARQDALMEMLGVEKVYTDKCSGNNLGRPQLQEMMNFVREGDTVVVESFSRFSRSTRDLLELVQKLTEKNVSFESQKEHIDTNTPQGRFMLTVFSALAQLEREVTRERADEGIREAKKRGVYKGRKPREIDPIKWRILYERWREGNISAVAIQKELGISSPTFYRRVKKTECSAQSEDMQVNS